jgi:hypothetical protein
LFIVETNKVRIVIRIQLLDLHDARLFVRSLHFGIGHAVVSPFPVHWASTILTAASDIVRCSDGLSSTWTRFPGGPRPDGTTIAHCEGNSSQNLLKIWF